MRCTKNDSPMTNIWYTEGKKTRETSRALHNWRGNQIHAFNFRKVNYRWKNMKMFIESNTIWLSWIIASNSVCVCGFSVQLQCMICWIVKGQKDRLSLTLSLSPVQEVSMDGRCRICPILFFSNLILQVKTLSFKLEEQRWASQFFPHKSTSWDSFLFY